MILDKQNLFSDSQALTATAVSTNVIDLGADDSKIPAEVEKNAAILAQVDTTFAGGTSVQVGLYTDDNDSFSSATLLQETAAVQLFH